ncbi:MAG: hypothetical protein WCV85_01450 [Patescibacteria group bacterium]|jgi:hypothetical protein
MTELTTTNPAVFLFREFVQDILLFPVWWYGKGLAKASTALWHRTTEFVQRSRWSPVIWVKNLFVPMYGDYTKSGRAISFFVRTVVALALTVVLVVVLLIYLAAFCLYLLAPVLTVYYVLYQIFHLPWLI